MKEINNPPAENILGTEKVGKLLIKFAIPGIISMVVNSLSKQIIFQIPATIILPMFMGIEGVLWTGPVSFDVLEEDVY